MQSLQFERAISFFSITLSDGTTISLPIVTVTLIQADGNRVSLPLVFDTGASVTSLRKDMYILLGLSSWDVGARVETATGGGEAPVDVYRYEGIVLEVLGKTLTCPVQLIPMPPNPFYVGLLGRETVFQEFGFGFWESTKQLYVTSAP